MSRLFFFNRRHIRQGEIYGHSAGSLRHALR